MEIYQVIECGGQYEDAYEFERGTFLKEENAVSYLEDLEDILELKKEEVATQLKKCSQCYDEFVNAETDDEFEKANELARANCPFYKEDMFDLEEGLNCEHYYENCNLDDSDEYNCRYTIREFSVLDVEEED